MSAQPKSGFTLIEVLVALAIGGIAVASAVALFLALSDRIDAIDSSAARGDREANAEQMLRFLALNLEPQGTEPSLTGDADSASFHSWCDTPYGWLDRCTVILRAAGGREGTVVSLAIGGAFTGEAALRPLAGRARLLYLTEVDHRLHWVDTWGRTNLPMAIGIATPGDTLLFPVQRDG